VVLADAKADAMTPTAILLLAPATFAEGPGSARKPEF